MDRKNILASVIGILILALLLTSFGPEKIISLITSVDVGFFVLAGLSYFVCDLLSTLVLMKAFPGLRFLDALLSHMCGMLYSALTPGRVGYYYVAYSLSKKFEGSTSGNAGVLTLVQGVNFTLKVVLSLLSSLYFSSIIAGTNVGVKYYLLLVSLAPITVIALILLVLYTSVPNKILGKHSSLARIRGMVGSMQDASRSVKPKTILYLVVLGVLGWVMLGVQYSLLIRGLGYDMGLVTCLMMQPLLSAVMFVPFVPAGLGLTETGSALLFGLIGLSPADGVAFMLLARLNYVLVDSVGVLDMKILGGKKT